MEELTKMIENIRRKKAIYSDILESLEEVKAAEEEKRPVRKLLTITEDTVDIITKRFKRFYLLIAGDDERNRFVKRLFKLAAENNEDPKIAYGTLDADEYYDLAKQLLSQDTVCDPEILCIENGQPKKNSIYSLKIEDILKDAIVKVCEQL